MRKTYRRMAAALFTSLVERGSPLVSARARLLTSQQRSSTKKQREKLPGWLQSQELLPSVQERLAKHVQTYWKEETPTGTNCSNLRRQGDGRHGMGTRQEHGSA